MMLGRLNTLRITSVPHFVCLFFLFTWSVSLLEAQCTDTTNKPPALPSKYTWPQDKSLTINIDPAFQTISDGTTNADAEIRRVLQNFQDASASNGSGLNVTAHVTTISSPPGGDGTVNIWFTTIPNQLNPDGSWSFVRGRMTPTFNAAGTRMSSASVGINKYMSDPVAVSQVVAEEIAHTLGVDDCFYCQTGKSVTSQPDPKAPNPLNQRSGTQGPTPCDNATIKAAGQYGGGGGGSDCMFDHSTTTYGPDERQDGGRGLTCKSEYLTEYYTCPVGDGYTVGPTWVQDQCWYEWPYCLTASECDDPDYWVCDNGNCVRDRGGLGDSCYFDDECEPGLVCDWFDLTCVYPNSGGGYGQPCFSDSNCQSPLVCDPNYLICGYRPDWGCHCRIEGMDCLDNTDCDTGADPFLYCDPWLLVCVHE